MLARLYILMPYTVHLIDGDQFPLYESVDGAYKVIFRPPVRAEIPGSRPPPEGLMLNNRPAFEANFICIDFYKEKFERAADGAMDPPEEVIRRAVGEFHSRLRFTTQAAHARPVSFPWSQWKLDYLNDDGSPLEKEEGLLRGRGTIRYEWSFIGLTKDVWDAMFNLPVTFEVPVWDSIRLDSQAALPNVGSAVVLATTALEVFISVLLDALAVKNGFSKEFWKWINERGDKRGGWLRQPTVEEQYDVLLKQFCGHSLKDESMLWEAFKNLKSARNTFVHEGVAMLGKSPLTKDEAAILVGRVNDIIAKVREWVPEDLRWPRPEVKISLEFTQMLIEPSKSKGAIPGNS